MQCSLSLPRLLISSWAIAYGAQSCNRMSENPIRDSAPAKFYAQPALDLAEAIHAGDDQKLEELIATNGYDLSDRGRQDTPLLLYAAAADRLSAVRILLQHGANPNDIGDIGHGPMSLVAIASGMEKRGFFDLLLESGADPNGIDGTEPPIFVAISAKNWDIMRALLARGADYNKVDSSGDSPLIALALTNSYQQALELIAIGADPWYTSPAGVSVEAIIRRFPLDPSTEMGLWQQKVIQRLDLKL